MLAQSHDIIGLFVAADALDVAPGAGEYLVDEAGHACLDRFVHDRQEYLRVACVRLPTSQLAVVNVPPVELVVAPLPLALETLADVLHQLADFIHNLFVVTKLVVARARGFLAFGFVGLFLVRFFYHDRCGIQ